jgi:proline dehydrogenase
MTILFSFAKRFIAGEDIPTALKATSKMHTRGYLTSMDLLGEHVHTASQAEDAKIEYLHLISHFVDAPHPQDFSVKLTQMGLEVHRDLCEKNIEEILKTAENHTVRFDIEGSDHTEATMQICIKLHKQYSNLGQAVQAYLFRTESDVENLLHENISIRLCKGAYKEPPSVAHQSMRDIRDNFRKLAFCILKEGYQPAIATHDEFLLKEILTFIEKENIDVNSFYFEMLYGVRRDLQKSLFQKGYQVRIYVPFGKSWLPYTLRRLAEKKENIFFVLKSLIKETFSPGKFE